MLDLTKLKGGDRLNHGKFAESPEVVKLIGNRLIAGQDRDRQRCRAWRTTRAVALGTAQTVGGAASVAVSTPIAIFDPATRRSYNDQVGRFGQAVGNTVETAVGQ